MSTKLLTVLLTDVSGTLIKKFKKEILT